MFSGEPAHVFTVEVTEIEAVLVESGRRVARSEELVRLDMDDRGANFIDARQRRRDGGT